MTPSNHFRSPAVTVILTLAILLLSHFSWGSNLSTPLNAIDEPPQTIDFNPSLGSSITSGLSDQVRFLDIDDAYQLSAVVNNNILSLHWDIAPGYYLYQHQTKVILAANAQSLSFDTPKGDIKYDEFFQRDLEVYYQQLDVHIELPTSSEPTAYILQVHSQGCADAGLCYPPHTQHLKIDGNNVTQVSRHEVISAPDVSNAFSTSTFMLSVLAAIVGGVLLNLMPCVFPVLSLKALSLMQQSDKSHQKQHGWAYTAGAIATFTLIAAIMFSLRNAGQAIGWGFQLQSPVVIASLAYLFFSIGLLLFGRFNLAFTFAVNLSNRGQHLTEGSGLRGSFFTGALASVVASPCTAPFMASALGYAITLPFIVGLVVFAALGFGMALPFLLLTHIPQLSKKLPKPGRWMETLKQVLAFPMFLTALWLLWVLGRQTNSDTVVAFTAGGVFITAALWLYSSRRALWTQISALILLAGALLPYQIIGETTAQPLSKSLSNDWQPYTHTRFEQLRNSQQPVFINLSADWCITCLSNEKIALDTKTSIAAFRSAGVIKLKGDWTHYNPEITHLLGQYQRSGVPLYLLFPAGTASSAQVLPQLLTETRVLAAINALER